MTNENQAPTNNLNNSADAGSGADVLENFKIHREVIKDGSPLSLVREKEVDLKKKVIETQIQADKIVAEAKAEAEKLRPKIEADARKKVETYYKDKLAKIEEEAKKLTINADEQVKQVESIGAKNFDKTIEKLRSLVVPS